MVLLLLYCAYYARGGFPGFSPQKEDAINIIIKVLER